MDSVSGPNVEYVVTRNQIALYIFEPPFVSGVLKLYYLLFQFSSVQLLSHVWLFVTPWITACEASLSITNSWSLPKPMSTESLMPSSHLILCHPLLLLPPIPPSIRDFSNESWGGQSIGVSASVSVLPMNTQDWSPLGWTGWISLQNLSMGFPGGTSGKESTCQCRRHKRHEFNPSGRFCGGGHGNTLQYPCLVNPKDIGAWQATVHKATKSQTLKLLSTHAHTLW